MKSLNKNQWMLIGLAIVFIIVANADFTLSTDGTDTPNIQDEFTKGLGQLQEVLVQDFYGFPLYLLVIGLLLVMTVALA